VPFLLASGFSGDPIGFARLSGRNFELRGWPVVPEAAGSGRPDLVTELQPEGRDAMRQDSLVRGADASCSNAAFHVIPEVAQGRLAGFCWWRIQQCCAAAASRLRSTFQWPAISFRRGPSPSAYDFNRTRGDR
jgi:hypothetical protein